MFDHMDGGMRALVEKNMEWKGDLYFAKEFARQKLSNYYAVVPPESGLCLIPVYLRDPFRKLRLIRKWKQWIDIILEDESL